jgi:scyllo-inositol 2-dehydrogenase (NADP+)
VPYLHDIKDSYYDNIADHLYNSAELLVKPEQARRIIAIIETTEKSALAGTELNLPYENE